MSRRGGEKLGADRPTSVAIAWHKSYGATDDGKRGDATTVQSADDDQTATHRLRLRLRLRLPETAAVARPSPGNRQSQGRSDLSAQSAAVAAALFTPSSTKFVRIRRFSPKRPNERIARTFQKNKRKCVDCTLTDMAVRAQDEAQLHSHRENYIPTYLPIRRI
ncbi:hypothetical protein V9T40_004641 [Parthenolecanium corni]|uniref:Uncharacterized protein n=1 Tax=Parthenolecanium corni TaxID=536013 RepID=A0AAN9TCD2_9HEMI